MRGARLWSAEVGSLFKQEMGWKTSGFSIFVAGWARFCAFVNDGVEGDITVKKKMEEMGR